MIWAFHGNLGSPEDWSAVRSSLAAWSLRCVNLWEPEPRDFGDWTRRFYGTPERGPQPRDVLLGYSLGARLAMHLLLERPEVWGAAIFISGHPGLTDAGERRQRCDADLRWAERLRMGGVAEFAERWNAQAVFAGEIPPPEQPAVLQRHHRAIQEAFDCWSLGKQEDLAERLRYCPVPQLWVAGERDPKFTALALGMARDRNHVTAAILADCGHRVPLQKPHELAECADRFLKACKLENADVDPSRKI